ncbi:MAG: hypothetical protein M3R55_14960 [Acidobacteriota bacterium]|nr:hypothetical protein [Acidobacteriota bacterium]
MYWFIPLTWHAARRAATLRERASDDQVLRAGVRATTYAESLLALARLSGGAELQPAALAMARPSRMRERVVAILDPDARRDAPAAHTVVGMLAASLAAIAALASVQPAAAAPLPESRIVGTAPAVSRTAAAPRMVDAAAPPAPPSDAAAMPATDAPAPAAIPAGISDGVQSPSRPCSGGQSDSTSISDENGTRKWKIKLSGDGCKVDLNAEGRITFSADFTDISGLDRSGFFRLDVIANGVRRQLEITSSPGSLSRTWRVDGREQPYDAAARAWFADFLIDLDRRTAIGMETRLPHLLGQGGVSAVLRETALMHGDYARTRYYEGLSKSAQLSRIDVTAVLTQASQLVKSDYYANEVIEKFASHGVEDASQRAAIVAMIERMESDYYQAAAIERLVSTGPPTAAEVDLLVRMVPRMSSITSSRR